MSRRSALSLLLAATLLSAAPASAQISRVANNTLQLPTNPAATYTLQTAFTGVTFTAPIGFATPPGETNRLFVVERAGRIKVIPNLNSPTSATFLDISSRVTTSGEEGLLGLAFHPSYASNGFFYVFYSTTVSNTHRQRLSRFKVSTSNANAADVNSELVMIEQADDYTNHNGGDLHFGPDGYLYVSLGDEGNGNDAGNNTQTITKDFFSALLRIDVDKKAGNLTPKAHASVKTGTYLVPADNPFVNATTFNGVTVDPTKVRTEFWAVGLRNPWRFTFDSATGKLWLADVGQSAREEIDIIEKGKNYGWAFREGRIAGPKAAPAGVTPEEPIWDYPTTDGKSIIGGVVYRGSNLVELAGAYIYGDYVSGNLWALQGSGPYTAVKLGVDVGVASFGVDPRNGDVLIANVTGNAVKRLVRASGGGVIPATLSATGAFSSLAALTPNAGIVAYTPTVPFWSDHALKSRWFSVPNVSNKITFATDSNWTLPTGSIWIKHFDIEMERGNPATRRRLETRFLVKTASGGYGVTYRWNQAQTDADLVPDAGLDEPLTITVGGVPTTQVWRYPSRAQCMACHTSAGGFALSFNTRQLNSNYPYQSGSANQIQALSNAGYFTAAVTNIPSLPTLARPDDTSASLELRSRSYLQVNCAQCHQPGGGGLGAWDARIVTPLASAGIINGVLNDTGGDAANRVVVPQDPSHSMLLRRMQNLPSAPRMPPIGSNVIDQASVTLVTDWVNSIVVPTEVVHEAETLTRTSAGATTAPNADAMSSGGSWIALSADGVGDTVDYTIPSLAAGTYSIKMMYKSHPNRGILSLKVDGTQVGGTLDQYAATVGYPETTFGNVTFATATTHTIRLTVTGKNAASGAYTLSADRFTLVKQSVIPAAPTGVTASGGNAQVVLGWAPVSGATSYTVKWSTTSGGGYTPITGITGTSYTHTGRTNGTTYYYVVSATGSGGESLNSGQVSATPQAPLPPAAPSNVIPTAGNAQVALSWTAVSGATSYTVKWSTIAGGGYTPITVSGTSYLHNPLSNGTTYYYVVSATGAGGEGANSGEVSATPQLPPPPDAPTGLSATAGNGLVNLSWTASAGATSYTVKRSLTTEGPYTDFVQSGITTTSFTNTMLVNGTTYFYVVSATGTGGQSPDSGEASDTPHLPPPPAAPTGLTATAGNGLVNLSWTASAGATSYTVKRSLTTEGPYTDFVQSGITTTSYPNTMLVNGTTYFYVVSATGTGGESLDSAEASDTPHLPPPPAAPTGLTATPGNGLVNLAWSASAGATSYTVKRSLTTGGPYTNFIQSGITATSYTNNMLPNGTTYYYVVSATGTGGESANSLEKSATTLTPPSAPISNLVVNDTATTNPPAGTDGIANSTQWSIQTNFQVNVTAFGDRTVKVTAVPAGGSVLLGKSWIRTAADSKNYTGTPLATFTVGGTFVYLAVDNRHNTGTRPTWLDASYVDQNYDITITEGTTARPYSVYRKPVTAGSTVTLPTVGSAVAPLYIVIVQ